MIRTQGSADLIAAPIPEMSPPPPTAATTAHGSAAELLHDLFAHSALAGNNVKVVVRAYVAHPCLGCQTPRQPLGLDGLAAQNANLYALAEHGWQVLGEQPSPIPGSKGAVETFLHARSR